MICIGFNPLIVENRKHIIAIAFGADALMADTSRGALRSRSGQWAHLKERAQENGGVKSSVYTESLRQTPAERPSEDVNR